MMVSIKAVRAALPGMGFATITNIMSEKTSNQPVISVVVEGYNETRDLGTAEDTLAAIEAQDFTIDKIEVILVGSTEQADHWKTIYTDNTKFHSVKVFPQNGTHYYQLKNGGAEIATGDIIAFTDSDVRPRPTWVSAIVKGIEDGADVVVGPSLFRQEGGLSPDSPIMRVAAAVTWGWIIGERRQGPTPEARGFMDHNVAMRTSVFRAHKYRTEFGRIIASPLLYRAFVNAGLKVAVQPGQQAAHHFTWRYWLICLEFRYGNEVFRLRRLDRDYPNQWITKTGIFEPLVTMGWHMLLDIPKWFRFARLLGTSFPYRLACLPLLVLMSAVARSAEMVGMYATMFAPKKMRQWAENL